MNVLVDSSVWIDYFRNGDNKYFEQLLTEDIVVTNDIILSELIPALAFQKQNEVIVSLESIECIPLSIDWQLIRRYQILNLANGINRVGIPDLIILQQTIEKNLTLYSFDKHFELMKNHLDFKTF